MFEIASIAILFLFFEQFFHAGIGVILYGLI